MKILMISTGCRLALLLSLILILAVPAGVQAQGTDVPSEITEDTTWTRAGSPYNLNGTMVTVHNDNHPVTLTLESGAEIRGFFHHRAPWNENLWSGITVGKNGALKILGTAGNPVVFTSDDAETRAGRKPKGDWNSVFIQADSRASETIIQHAIFEYSGAWGAPALNIEGGSPEIKDSIFRLNTASGIEVAQGANPTITNCRFENNAPTVALADSFPSMVDNSFANDQVIFLEGNITRSGTLRVPGVLDNGNVAPYDLGYETGINVSNTDSPITLTIEAGVEIRGRTFSGGGELYHSGIHLGQNAALEVRGTENAPVRFTSSADEKQSGGWGGVVINGNARGGETVIQHAIFEYGGAPGGGEIAHHGHVPGMLSVYGGAPRVSHSVFQHSATSGIHVEDAAPTVTENKFIGNRVGLTFQGASTPTVSGNIIKGNTEWGAHNHNADVTHDMTDNWWGDASGPLDDSDDTETGGSYNPQGKGDRVSDYIRYEPWRTSETGGTGEIPPQAGTLSGKIILDEGTDHSGVTVRVDGNSVTTDSDGGFTMADISPGTYTVTASKPGYQDIEQTGVVVEAGEITDLPETTLISETAPPAEAIITVKEPEEGVRYPADTDVNVEWSAEMPNDIERYATYINGERISAGGHQKKKDYPILEAYLAEWQPGRNEFRVEIELVDGRVFEKVVAFFMEEGGATSKEPADVSGMTLQAGQRRVEEDGTVNVPVWLINGANVANVNFSVTYDAGVATPEGDLVKGSLLDNALFSSNPAEAGLIQAGFAQTSGLGGTGTVAYIPFRAVGKPGDRTPLELAVTTINNPDGTVLDIDRIDGEILIVGPDGVVPGDCDGDGVLNALDALCALQMSVDLIPERLAMDLDDDSQVTSRDSVVILQRAIGK